MSFDIYIYIWGKLDNEVPPAIFTKGYVRIADGNMHERDEYIWS